MALRLLAALAALFVCLASARSTPPPFPHWPTSYSTNMVSETATMPPTQTMVYIDSVNRRSRFDVPASDGTVTELIFQPPNPSVQPTIFYIITATACDKQISIPPTPGPPAPPGPTSEPMNCTNFMYEGKSNAHNESCDTWNMICHQGTNTITTTYLWFGQTPVRLSSISLHSSYVIDYFNFTAGVPPASLWDLPPQCSRFTASSASSAAARKAAHAVFALHEALTAEAFGAVEVAQSVGDAETCEEMKELVEPHFPPQEADIVECLSWFYTGWNATAVQGTRYGLWLIDQSWCGQGPCPPLASGLFNTTASVECLAYALNDSGFTAWQAGLTQCVAWLKQPSSSPVPKC